MRKSTRLLGMFIVSAVFSFVVSFSGAASSSIRTVKWVGCTSSGLSFVCPLVHSSTHPLASLTHVYYDFYAVNGSTYTLYLRKTSVAGSSFTDTSTYTATSTGSVDLATNAVNVLTNPNQYDQLTAWISKNTSGVINGRGMASVTSY